MLWNLYIILAVLILKLSYLYLNDIFQLITFYNNHIIIYTCTLLCTICIVLKIIMLFIISAHLEKLLADKKLAQDKRNEYENVIKQVNTNWNIIKD